MIPLASAILLFFGVFVAVLCCLGMLRAANPLSRLHFIGPVSLLSSVAVSLAILLAESFSQAGIKSILMAVVLMATGPILSHATAKALYIRRESEGSPQRLETGSEKEGES